MSVDPNWDSLASRLYAIVEKSLSPLELNQLLEQAKQPPNAIVSEVLADLERRGQLMKTRQGLYTLPERLGLVVGRVMGHREGFGFLRTADKEQSDLFLPNRQMLNAMHGDLVVAAPTGLDKRGRREAKIIRVLEAVKSEIVGRLFCEGGSYFVVPDDRRIAQDIQVAKSETQGARQGQIVVVELLSRAGRGGYAQGKVIEVLGEKMEPGMEVAMALRSHDIPHVWPAAVNKAVAKIDELVDEASKQGRVDLTALPLVTIDGEDARDFDDAVFCEPKKSGGWRLWVAIADVSYYVRPSSALDKEAFERGNSVYFPDQVVPMLPEKLSNGLCSLNPEVDRLCMVCEMTISEAGRLSGYQFYEAVMHSHARLTYNKVAAILEGDELLSERYRPQVEPIKELHRLYQALKEARAGRGGIELETQEARFIFNAQRKIEQVVPLVRNDAHKIIEECMIQANVAAARYVEKNKAAILFRVHERPSTERLTNFRSFLNELGLSLGGGEQAQPTDYFKLVKDIGERDDKELIQTMLLRSMMQAVYQPDNVGHFGLALSSYAHFTSPIRRYPDLLLHRVIKYLVAKEQGEIKQRWTPTGGYDYQLDEMDAFGEQCSMTERRADDATREVADKLKCEFMLDHVGDAHQGSVAAVTNFGLFVRLDDLHIDGLVHIGSLRRDYYEYDAARQMLIGQASGQRYRIGDKLRVKVASVNIDDRKIDFVLLDDNGEEQDSRSHKRRGRGASPTGRNQGSKTSDKTRAGTASKSQRDSGAKKNRDSSTTDRSGLGAKEKNKPANPWDRTPKGPKKKPSAAAKKKSTKKRKSRPGRKERAGTKAEKK
jgi:ribonuclease R